jgi:RNA polymerase-binding transcription factor DksA
MPDLMDGVQERLLFEQAMREQRRGAAVPPVGLDECIRCDGPISALRRNMGARLCLGCQADDELRWRLRGGR